MCAAENNNKSPMTSIRFYGTSAKSVRSDVDEITGLQSGRKPIRSNETGTVTASSEFFGGAGGADGYCSGGGGEGEVYCLLIAAVLLAVFAIVWTIVMVAFAIMTFGGFIRRRYRTLLYIEKENPEFIGKLAILSFRKGGVAKHSLGNEPYDEWVDKTFSLFMRKKYLRQVSFFFSFIWGSVEVLFKLYQILLDPTFSYDLWPLRIVMVAIFLPLLLYAPILEISIRGAFERGGEIVDRLIMENPSFSPDHPMSFEITPWVVDSIPSTVIKGAGESS